MCVKAVCPDASGMGTRKGLRHAADGRGWLCAAWLNQTLRGPVLVFGEVEAVVVDLRPLELEDLALPAAGEQEQPDDVGLLPAGGPLPDQPIKDAVKPFDLPGGEEPGEFRAGVLRDAP